jgi:c-di-GMP-binding flagellar brake protein YcgR
MDGSLLDSAETAVGARFSDLQLKVGDRLQLQPPKQATEERCIVRLIGYVEGSSVLVTPPFQGAQRLQLFEGEELVVRAFTGRSAFGFATTIDKAVKHPFEYLHLAYPSAVQAMQVRKAVRVTTDIIASVTAYNREDMEPVPAVIADVSSSGALIDAGQAIGEVGDLLRIVFRVRLHGVDSDLTVDAFVRNRYAEYIQTGGVATVHHGVEFNMLAATDSMIFESLIYQQLVENPRLRP